MPAIEEFKTIPELFKILTDPASNRIDNNVIKHKPKETWDSITYRELREETENLAFGLASMGLKRDDKVSIISENRPEWVYTDFACQCMGYIDVPLYPILTSESLEFIINNSESVCIFVSNEFQLNKLMKVWDNCKGLKFAVIMNEADVSKYENVYNFKDIQKMGVEYKKENPKAFESSVELAREDDVCTIIYTSGTTGEPKGVILTHKNIISNVNAAHKVLYIDNTDIFLSFLPLCHIFERMAGYYTALSAGSLICYAESIEKIASNMEECKPTVMTAVPRLFERMFVKIKRNVENQPEKKQKIFNWAIETGKDFMELKRERKNPGMYLSLQYKLAERLVFNKLRARTGGRLRFFISGGAALPRELGFFFEAAGILILEGYGLTETSPVIAVNRPENYKFGTVGMPIPGVDVKIAHDGEILTAGPHVMQGYYKNKKETDAVLKDGWLHTGDIGVFDAEGFLIITDRKKHLFKTTAGKYIAPQPIENMFSQCKYIDQFVLIGDKRRFLTALIVPDYESLKEYADAHRINYTDEKELTNLKQIYDLLEKDLNGIQRKLANYERVRKFTILEQPFSVENGELTPKLSIRRKVIEERYKSLIEDMYEGLEA